MIYTNNINCTDVIYLIITLSAEEDCISEHPFPISMSFCE